MNEQCQNQQNNQVGNAVALVNFGLILANLTHL